MKGERIPTFVNGRLRWGKDIWQRLRPKTIVVCKNRQHKMQELQVGHRYPTKNGCYKLILSSFLSVLVQNSLCNKSKVAPHINLCACAGALGLFHTCGVCMDSLYPYIQCLDVEFNSYLFALSIAERCLFVILYWVTNISPFLIWYMGYMDIQERIVYSV